MADRVFDAVVIGAGIVGSAVAERLLAGSPRGGEDPSLGRVAIVEKESAYCTGSSARSAGGVRQQFAAPHKIRAAMYSLARYEIFEDLFGVDPSLRHQGYLILAATGKSAAGLRRAVAVQRRLGLDSRFLEPRDIAGVVPSLETFDLAGASFSLRDGFLDPHSIVQGLVRAFRARGGTLILDCAVEGFLSSRGRVTGVATSRGPLRAGIVVVAAGPFSGGLLERAGISLPLKTCRRQIFTAPCAPGVEAHWPLVLDPDNSFYFRPESGGVIMSLAEAEEMDPPRSGNDIPFSRDGLPELALRATSRCPLLARARVNGGWAGLRTLTPDETPVIGPLPGLEGLYVAAGFSGHGVTLSPYAAEAIAALVSNRPAAGGGITPFLPRRFL